MARQRLANRRVNRTHTIWWPPPPDAAAKKIHISVGFDDQGHVRECFVRGGTKSGHERDSLYDDLAVILSRLLQHGDPLADIVAGLSGRGEPTPEAPQGGPASLIGAIVDCLILLEREEQADVRSLMDALAGRAVTGVVGRGPVDV